MDKFSFIKTHSPCYLYDISEIKTNCAALKNHLHGFDFLYSIKANPYPPIINAVREAGLGADAASAREVGLALESGIIPENIYYSSPGKTKDDLERCFGKCVIIADSFSEIRLLDAVASHCGKTAEIGVRINPAFTMNGDAAGPGKFGIDAEKIHDLGTLLNQCSHLKLAGIHIHICSQILDTDKLGQYYLKCFELARNIAKFENCSLKFINFGSGIGTVYDRTKEQDVKLTELAKMTAHLVEENNRTLKARLLIETGRFVVCNAGTYYTQIVDIKESRGIKYLIVKNGLNGFLRPSIAALLENAADTAVPSGQEPLYTSNHAFQCSVL